MPNIKRTAGCPAALIRNLITIYYNRNYGLIIVFVPNVTELNRSDIVGKVLFFVLFIKGLFFGFGMCASIRWIFKFTIGELLADIEDNNFNTNNWFMAVKLVQDLK